MDVIPYEKSLFTARFIGKNFSNKGVDIYDLGITLLAIQRLIHKAYLCEQNRPIIGSTPSQKERKMLALQVGDRQRKSDAYALISYLTSLEAQAIIHTCLDFVNDGLIGYYTGRVLDRIIGEQDDKKRIFIATMYPEIRKMTDRIQASGRIKAISLGSPIKGKETIASFNSESKQYIAGLAKKIYLGSYQEIKGIPNNLYPESRIIKVKRAGGKVVTMFLNETDFDEIRYRQEKNPTYIFKGRPKFKFGVETKIVKEFAVDEIEYVEDD